MIGAARLSLSLLLNWIILVTIGQACPFSVSIPVSDSTKFQKSTQSFIAGNHQDLLLLDLYVPPQEVAPGWGIIFLHGGGFSAGSRDDSINSAYCGALATKGVAVASMDYRLRQVDQGFHCDVPISDKREAIRWAAEDLEQALLTLKTTFPEGMVVCGTSAGAEAALFAAFHLELPEISGVIGIAGAMEPLAVFRSIPVLAYHGTCDALVPFCQAIHHYCPSSSLGALHLMGSGAIAAQHSLVKLNAMHSAGHEISSSLLIDSEFVQASVDFLLALKSSSFQPGIHEIHLSLPCDSLPTNSLPCITP